MENKRTALHCALTFMEINGYEIDLPAASIELYEMTMTVAQNQINKDQLAEWFREHMQPAAE